MGIEFLIDDAQRAAEELNEVSKEFKKPVKRKPSKNTRILKKFVVALYHASESKHKKKAEKIKKETIQKIVDKQFPERTIRRPQVRIEPSFKQPVLKKEVERELPSPPVPNELKETQVEAEDTENGYPLVVLKNNKKVIARAIVNDKYELIEPKLDKVDIEILSKLQNIPERNFEKILKKLCKKHGIKFSENYTDKIKYYLRKELGKIDALLKDSKITSISADGVEKNVKVKHNGKELSTNINFISIEEINDLINKLAKKLGQQASPSSQIEGTLPTGHRVQAMLGSNEITPRFMIEKK